MKTVTKIYILVQISELRLCRIFAEERPVRGWVLRSCTRARARASVTVLAVCTTLDSKKSHLHAPGKEKTLQSTLTCEADCKFIACRFWMWIFSTDLPLQLRGREPSVTRAF
ncbi:hypothetical protein GDO78_022202 [Eleutherodactylus coqui]|uniref:Uncharacterized protein n=1 Tax=Eleutherodactylus coqui TaxID=57060 RepID=A0A8J6EC71_ELECQ|nr:hypothetical protein GDO78_022202 [Eleutherodactylus coqui]